MNFTTQDILLLAVAIALWAIWLWGIDVTA
jgi:hypothetical protein